MTKQTNNLTLALLLTGLTITFPVHADEALATYLANEGVLVTHGQTSILFDPVFDNGYGRYELVPEEMVQAMLASEPPFQEVDAVFVSHYHGDHFAAIDMIAYLNRRPSVHLYAPEQAVHAMQQVADIRALRPRITAIDLKPAGPTASYEVGAINIGVAAIPHSGWPTRMTDVQNLAFRVTLDGVSTVLHLGDADTKDKHYEPNAEFWASQPIDLAMPPYWYFTSKNGSYVLANRLKPADAVGIHVPADVPDDPQLREGGLQAAALFTRPGQTRVIPHQHGPAQP